MKTLKYFLSIILSLTLLTACSESSSSKISNSNTESSSQTSSEIDSSKEDSTPSNDDSDKDEPEKEDTIIESSMAILEIRTVNTDKNAIDFVTKPVAEHVSEQIATWTPNYEMPPSPYYETCNITLTDTDKNVLLNSVEAQVKVRGNWTTTYDKKALRIKFTEKQNMLGLNDGAEMKNWTLLAEYKDASILRNKTALSIANEILAEDGLYCSDAEFVEVYINGNYWGVYLLAEHQQINNDRINITEAEKDYTGTDIGYFLELDGYYYIENELNQFHVDYCDNAELIPFDGNGGSGKTITCFGPEKKQIGMTIKSDIYSQEQHDFIAGFVNGVYDIMYYAAYEDKAYVFNDDYTEIYETSDITPREAIERVVNVNSLADLYIVSEIVCDADIYWSSFFMSVDFGENGDKKLTFTAPWDYDSAMGNKDRCADGTGFFAANIVPDVNGEYSTVNPWLTVIMYEDWYQDIIKSKWTKAYDNGVFTDALEMIKNDKEAHSEAIERNYDKWNNIINNGAFSNELSQGAAECKNHAEATDYLYNWLEKRIEFLNEYWHE